jgi:hypothetical protein
MLDGGYSGRISDAADFARRNRVLLLNSPQGIPIALALGALPFEALAVDRSSLFTFAPNCVLRTCSAEDLIVQKLFSFRTRDLLDVETVVVRQQGRLDWDYIQTRLEPMAGLKDQPEIMAKFFSLKESSGSPWRSG